MRAAPPPRVYVLLVDGLGADAISESLTPTLWDLVHGGGERTAFFARARAVLPSVTNANHVSLMTGVYPAAHGIVGNYYWERGDDPKREFLDRGDLVEVDTLFTALERERPDARTAAIFGKWKLAQLFGKGGFQRAPDRLWGDIESEHEFGDPREGVGSDERTMDEALRSISFADPDLLFVALGDVDRVCHAFGPESAEARKAILEADRQIDRLVSFVESKLLWKDLVLFITSDHGFATIAPDEDRPYPMVLFGRELARAGIADVAPVSNVSIESLYVLDLDSEAPTLNPKEAEMLKRVRALALAQPEIAEALYRLPNPADGGRAHVLDERHPAWRFTHPRIGELVLVARPGYFFNDPFSPAAGGMRGGHGAPDTAPVPIVVTGGYSKIRSVVVEKENAAENPDVGATARWLLDLPEPRTRDGRAVPTRLRGRVLKEAFATSQPAD